MADTSVKKQQQPQTFIVLKVLFHLSPLRASLLAHQGGQAGVIFLQHMRQQAESLGKRHMATEQTRSGTIPEKLKVPAMHCLIVQAWISTYYRLHMFLGALNFNSVSQSSNQHTGSQKNREDPACLKILDKDQKIHPHCQMPKQEHEHQVMT